MSFMDEIPPMKYSRIDDLVISSEKDITRDKLEAQVAEFLAKGGKIKEIESFKKVDLIDGWMSGVEKMGEFSYRVTYMGRLLEQGYYRTKKEANEVLRRHIFKTNTQVRK